MKPIYWIATILLTANCIAAAQAQGGRAQSPASQRPPQTVSEQSYPAELVRAGETRFSGACGFCHGRDAAGGETGPDLTRSTLVAEDLRGDKIKPVVRNGRADKGMPPFDLSENDLNAIVAFIHDQKTKSESVAGGRRGVDVADLATGNVEAGKRYFNGAGNCSKCHSATGDLAGVGTRFQGLALLQRMLYPAGRPAPAPAKVTVIVKATGNTVKGTLVSRDEFVIAVNEGGANRTFQMDEVNVTVDDPMSAHFDQLGKYTDDEMHNVYAYLQSLQ